MISLALAFAPVATVSLFAAAIPVLTGIRQRHASLPGRSQTEGALDITGGVSAEGDSLSVAVRSRSEEARTLCLSISVYDQAGAECARFELPARRLLAGRCAEERLDLHALPAGRYRAVLVAGFGGEWFGAQYDFARAPQPARLAPAA